MDPMKQLMNKMVAELAGKPLNIVLAVLVNLSGIVICQNCLNKEHALQGADVFHDQLKVFIENNKRKLPDNEEDNSVPK